jgi:hypothetical protein
MSRIRATKDGQVPFTPEEEAAADVKEQEWEAAAPEREAKAAKWAAYEIEKGAIKEELKDKKPKDMTKDEVDRLLFIVFTDHGLI